MPEQKWKRVGSNFPPVFQFDTKGACIEGVLKDIRHFPSKEYDKETYVYEIEANGARLSVFGTGQLDFLMKDIEVETLVRITYDGKTVVQIGKKKRNVHQFIVEVPS